MTGTDRIETLQPYILCANGRHTFVWSPHAPHGSFDYAAPAGLRCQCGEVEYKPRPAYMAYRADGWPLCPRCGQDELWSDAWVTLEESIAGIKKCYACGWQPPHTGSPADAEGMPLFAEVMT